MASLRHGEMLRAHGGIRDGVFAPTKLERLGDHSIGIEGVVRSVNVLANGDASIDVGGIIVLVDPRARWSDFPGEEPPLPSPAIATTTESPATEQLFDLEADPREQRNIAASNPAELARMRALTDKARAALQVRPSGDTGGATLDSETRERLRAMGYVE